LANCSNAGPSSVPYRTIRERMIAPEADIDEVTLGEPVGVLTDSHEAPAAIVGRPLFIEPAIRRR
jgi:hypothetical protein